MNPIIILTKARAVIARIRAFLDWLKKIKDYYNTFRQVRDTFRGARQMPAAPRVSGSAPNVGVRIECKVKLNPAGVRALLQSEEVGAYLEGLATSVAPPGTEVTNIVGRTRRNIRIADHSRDALDREAKMGHLSRALGRVV